MDEPKPPVRQVEERRERAIERLSRAFADDQLEVHELEERIDMAHRATSFDELDRLVADLPARVEGGGAAYAPPHSGGRAQAERPAQQTQPQPAGAPAPPSRRSRIVAAIFAGVTRKGRWDVPPHTYAIAFCGGADLDFRDVTMPGAVAHLTAVAFMGGVDIIVPPWMRVEVDGFAFMGGFESAERSEAELPPPDAPVLRIDGLAFMGGVDIMVRLPGEKRSDAKRRRRLERKRRLKG